MNRLEIWLLRFLLKRAVRQGFHHASNVQRVFSLMNEACEREFYEDNVYTRNSYLREWLEAALREKTGVATPVRPGSRVSTYA